MSLPVYLAESLAEVRPTDTVEVSGREAHHAVVVRRTGVGDRVALSDGAGTRVEGAVSLAAKTGFAVVVDHVEHTPPAQPALTVVQALPKGERGELAVQVLTEVGVDRIVPWAAARCVAVWRGQRAARGQTKWAEAAREAAKQARRSWFPEVTPLVGTAEVAALLGHASVGLVLHESATTPLAGLAVPATGHVVVVVGPEGGLSDHELESFAGAGGVPVRLGDSVLRTSTAGVVAVAAVLAGTPRWR